MVGQQRRRRSSSRRARAAARIAVRAARAGGEKQARDRQPLRKLVQQHGDEHQRAEPWLTRSPLATATPSTNVCISSPTSADTLTSSETECVSSPKWKCRPIVCCVRCTSTYARARPAARSDPRRAIDSGNRSTSETEIRKPAANDSIASSARDAPRRARRDRRRRRACSPPRPRRRTAAPDGVTPAAVRAAPPPRSRRSPGPAPPETAGDSSSSSSCARAAAPRALCPRADTATDPCARR